MIEIHHLKHCYGNREVLHGIDLSIQSQEIFGLLGPNGSGKTTLFRILSTALRPQIGSVQIASFHLPSEENQIRKKTGVVFQSPSLDGKLSVEENMKHHGHLFGLRGQELEKRCQTMLSRLGIQERKRERVDKLSGGLKRRVELAKSLLHCPEILILDEPSTGLDPGARLDLWKYLKDLRQEQHVTILVTTHLMEEAEHCDRIAIMNEGKIVQMGSPSELKRAIRGDVIVVQTAQPEMLAKKIREKFNIPAAVVEHTVQLEHEKGAELVAQLGKVFGSEIDSLTIRRPTLEDVFIHETGHKFWEEKNNE